jgi:ribonuclease BN (tRNA processing enzyme)
MGRNMKINHKNGYPIISYSQLLSAAFNTMRITVLGCNGSITGNRRTTCYQVGEHILIDAGSGAADLTLEAASLIDTVFLTHSHLDHCCMLPMLADSICSYRKPLNVYAQPQTISVLHRNIFNGEIYPDYTVQPSAESPYLRFVPLQTGESVLLGDVRITALPARHAVPCVGYQADSGNASWVYSADTTLCPEFWAALNNIDNLRHLLIETTFRNANTEDAKRSGHMTAQLLAEGLGLLNKPVDLCIVHMEAGFEDVTVGELQEAIGPYRPRILNPGDFFEL